MLYRILKLVARVAIKIFCRKLFINKPALLKVKGPLLLASNHPNSFLDSVILDTIFDQPVWSLARGDVFKKPFYIKLLTKLKILPVYRSSEGPENLPENYKTFEACIDLFHKNAIVCIFSEGKCINEWHLRPLKKGTARLAFKAWEENIPLRVLPVGINYSSFFRFGKNMFINFGEMMDKQDFNTDLPDGLRYRAFNDRLEKELKPLVFELPDQDKRAQELTLAIKPSVTKKILLSIPAALGWMAHLPIYLPVKKFVLKRTVLTDHYDSVMTGILLLVYPVYLLLIVAIAGLLIKSWWIFLLLLVIPFTAWSYVALKPQLDKERSYRS